MLYDINDIQPLSLAAATGTLAFAAALACWLPARRATQADPMEALRCE
jgi:ABC-type lipoprotein release transport system permease subunit